MNLTTTTRRIASTVAALGVLSLATALPAAAIPDPGTPVSTGAPTSQRSTSIVREVVVHEDDNAVEYLQIGLGAAGGLVLAGAAAAALGARRHRTQDAMNPA
jgi:hypothetical protein